ncbi:hypothetical protein ACSAZK_17885 [Methanosarcina sp. Mfa9]|uniref:hypothetical protein n=1 Tax=Methanosarcina sp. Mfa9 TaxID=3439063 RepID=UPI003F87E376
MAIGDQKYGELSITAEELRTRYDDLIKEAILNSRPDLEVIRSDDVEAPGGITSDIFKRIIKSDYVVADITYPNPNVFYELGIRHAIKPGTTLIKEKNGIPAPFDISHTRYIEYENTPTGLKKLSDKLRKQFIWFDSNPNIPDNQFIELTAPEMFEHFQSTNLGSEIQKNPEDDKKSEIKNNTKEKELEGKLQEYRKELLVTIERNADEKAKLVVYITKAVYFIAFVVTTFYIVDHMSILLPYNMFMSAFLDTTMLISAFLAIKYDIFWNKYKEIIKNMFLKIYK